MSQQITRQAVDVLASLMQQNAIEKLKEQAIFKNDSQDETKKVKNQLFDYVVMHIYMNKVAMFWIIRR